VGEAALERGKKTFVKGYWVGTPDGIRRGRGLTGTTCLKTMSFVKREVKGFSGIGNMIRNRVRRHFYKNEASKIWI